MDYGPVYRVSLGIFFYFSHLTAILMLTGLPLMLLILGILLFIVYACAVARWHPFPVLLVAALVLGLGAGLGISDTLSALLQGSGAVFAAIGFVIALGTVLGEVLERTGAV